MNLKQDKKQMPLETANEMFKTAFLVKKTKFSLENPKLNESEIMKITALYFKNLNEKK
jgi:hypothetical protein